MNKSRQYGLFTDVPDELWNDWHWQVANRIETLEDLKKYISLTPEEEEGVAKCRHAPHGDHSLLSLPHQPERSL